MFGFGKRKSDAFDNDIAEDYRGEEINGSPEDYDFPEHDAAPASTSSFLKKGKEVGLVSRDQARAAAPVYGEMAETRYAEFDASAAPAVSRCPPKSEAGDPAPACSRCPPASAAEVRSCPVAAPGFAPLGYGR